MTPEIVQSIAAGISIVAAIVSMWALRTVKRTRRETDEALAIMKERKW